MGINKEYPGTNCHAWGRPLAANRTASPRMPSGKLRVHSPGQASERTLSMCQRPLNVWWITQRSPRNYSSKSLTNETRLQFKQLIVYLSSANNITRTKNRDLSQESKTLSLIIGSFSQSRNPFFTVETGDGNRVLFQFRNFKMTGKTYCTCTIMAMALVRKYVTSSPQTSPSSG